MTTITASNLYPCFNCGTPNAKQLAMFGMKWPLGHGWAKEMIGRRVEDDFLQKLASLRKSKGGYAIQKIQPKPLLIRSCEFTDDNGNEMVHVQYDLNANDAKRVSRFIQKLSSDKHLPSAP